MAQKFLTDIELTRGLKDSSGDLGNSGQVLSSTGTGLNWINATSSASVVYQDGFTGDGNTTAFTLANSLDNENKSQVYIDGVYQHKDTYSLSNTTLTFSTAPPNLSDIEVISFSSVSAADDILYDDDFTSAGLMKTNGAGVYSIVTDNSSNWNTAYGWGDHSTQGYITDGNTNWNNSYGFITASSTDTLTNKSGNISMFTNDSGYITDGNTNWNNSYGFITASSTETLTNKSGNISMFTNDSNYATQSYVNTQVSNLVDSAPSTLDTLNELAAALGDDANFSTTVTNSIATKMPLAGGIFTGNVQFNDNIQLNFGSGADFKIKHNGSNTFLENYTGALYIDQNTDNGSIIFRNDDGSGGVTSYMQIRGGTEDIQFNKTATFASTATFNGDVTIQGGTLNLSDGSQYDSIINSGSSLTLNFDDDNNSTGEVFRINHDTTSVNANNLFSITEAGVSTASASFRAPIFYDTDNTGRYLNPADTSRLRHLQLWQAGDFDMYVSDVDAWIHCDARDEGTVAAAYKYTRSNSTGYGVYKEYWYDGNSYQSIRQDNDQFVFSTSVSATEFDLPSGGILDWANGDARIVEGLVNNYSLSFQTYDGSSVTTALRLDGDNTAHIAGSTEIKYVTSEVSSTFLTLHNDVGTDLSTQKTFIDFIFEDNNDNDWPQVRIGAEIGQNGNADSQLKEGSGAFVVYTNNATTNSPGSPSALNEKFRVDYRGYVGIGTAVPETKLDVYDSSTSVNIITARNATQKIALGVNDGAGGAFLFTNTNHDLRFGTNGSEVGRFKTGGQFRIANSDSTTLASIRLGGENGAGGRLYFEYNGDNSYIDCYGGHGSTQRYRNLSIVSQNLYLKTQGSTALTVDTSQRVALNNQLIVGTFANSQSNTGEAWIGRASDRSAGTLTVQLGTGTGRKFEVVDYNWTTVEFSATDGGIATAAASFRAPIFYDSNDTTYYLDPASGNRFKGITEFRTNAGNARGYIQATDTNDEHFIIATSGGEDIAFKDGGTGGTTNMIIRGDGDVLTYGNNYGRIWYDYDNTAYYLDPHGTTQLNAVLRENSRISNSQEYPIGHYTGGKEIWSIDPTWTEAELQQYFGNNGVSWSAQSDAPGGYAIYINGGVYVGGAYDSGFPYIPVESGAIYYMECYIKNVGTGQTHYMGSNEYNESFSSLGGNPGSYGYWVMSNTNPGTSWTKVHGIIRGNDANSVGFFENGTKYWTPMALFNYGAGSGTRACYISGWKVIKISSAEYIADGSTSAPSISFAEQKNNGIYRPGNNQLGLVVNSSRKVLVESDRVIVQNGFLESYNDVRSPIYYDRDNTGRYIDPATTSRIDKLEIANTSNQESPGSRMKIGSDGFIFGGNNDGYESNSAQISAGYHTANSLNFVGMGTSSSNRRMDFWAEGGFYVSGTIYDKDATNYFVDPGNDSQMNQIHLADYIRHLSDLNTYIGFPSNDNFIIHTNGTTRATISSSNSEFNHNWFRVSSNGTFGYGGSYQFHEINQGSSNQPTLILYNQVATTATQAYGLNVIHAAHHNNTTSRFFLGQGSTSEKIKIYSNGNIQNSNNSYGQLSDINVKENVINATPKLDEINQVRVVNFNYIGDVDEETGIPNKQIGVVAQELEQIFPGMVYECGDTETPTKSVKYSVFVPMLIKAVQELTQEVQTLKDQINGIN